MGVSTERDVTRFTRPRPSVSQEQKESTKRGNDQT